MPTGWPERTGEWLARCAELGVKVVSYSDLEMATQDSSTKILVALKSALAEFETDVMSTRQPSAKAHAAEAGFNHGGMRAIGWMPSGERETDEHGRSGIRLVPYPAEFPAVQDAITMALAGHSLKTISFHWAEVHGIMTAAGNPVYQSTVWRVLRSPHLLGYRRYQAPVWRKKGDHVRPDPLAHVARGPDGEPVVAHEPVCDMVTFLRLQRTLAERSNSRTRRPWGTHDWLLTGLLTCGACGDRLYGHQKKERSGSKTYRYICLAKYRRGREICCGLSVVALPAEDYVLGWLVGYVTDQRLAAAILRARQTQSGTADPIRANLALALEERSTLLRQQAEGTYRGSMVEHFLRLIDDAEVRIGNLERAATASDTGNVPVASNAELVANWPGWSLDQRRHALRAAITRIVVAPGRAAVERRLDVIPRI